MTEPIVAHYTSLNPTTAAALDNRVPAKSSFSVSGASTVLCLFLFILYFQFFYRQALALRSARRRFFKNKSGQLIHLMDDIDLDSDSSFLIITCEDFTALRALAKEALFKIEANAPFTYAAEDESKLHRDITART